MWRRKLAASVNGVESVAFWGRKTDTGSGGIKRCFQWLDCTCSSSPVTTDHPQSPGALGIHTHTKNLAGTTTTLQWRCEHEHSYLKARGERGWACAAEDVGATGPVKGQHTYCV
jgi:hypothetical protein